MQVCILGDTHFGMRGDSLEFHEHYRKFYETVFFPFLEKHNIKVIYQLGDLFDRRKFVNYNTLHLVRDYFFNKAKQLGIEVHTLIGNHDIYYKNTLDVNSPILLLSEYGNLTAYQKPQTIEIDGIPVDIIPWICDENEEEIMKFIRESKSQICFGHFELAGFEMDRGNVCHEGLDKSILRRYDVVLSGHFHHKSSDGQITFVGTPGEMTWADHGDSRGFHIFDTATRNLKFIENPYTIFRKITYDDSIQDFDFWKDHDYSQYKGTYVKIVVVNKSNPYMFDTVQDNIHKATPADISVIEDFADIDLSDDDDIDQAEDTITILNRYIDKSKLGVDSEKLKLYMRELYVEALNVKSE